MMKTFRIENITSGLILGDYRAETPEDAIRAMLADAGHQGEPSPDLIAWEV